MLYGVRILPFFPYSRAMHHNCPNSQTNYIYHYAFHIICELLTKYWWIWLIFGEESKKIWDRLSEFVYFTLHRLFCGNLSPRVWERVVQRRQLCVFSRYRLWCVCDDEDVGGGALRAIWTRDMWKTGRGWNWGALDREWRLVFVSAKGYSVGKLVQITGYQIKTMPNQRLHEIWRWRRI